MREVFLFGPFAKLGQPSAQSIKMFIARRVSNNILLIGKYGDFSIPHTADRRYAAVCTPSSEVGSEVQRCPLVLEAGDVHPAFLKYPGVERIHILNEDLGIVVAHSVIPPDIADELVKEVSRYLRLIIELVAEDEVNDFVPLHVAKSYPPFAKLTLHLSAATRSTRICSS